MRVYFRSTALPMRFAQAIRTVFPALNLLTAQEWAAQMFGYRNWHELVRESEHFTGQPTDVWREDPAKWDNSFLGPKDSRPVDDYDVYQNKVLTRLAAGFMSESWRAGALYRVYDIAKTGKDPAPRLIELGKGTPLFNSLQKAWFYQEDHARVRRNDMDVPVFHFPAGAKDGEERSMHGYSVYCGFRDAKIADRWYDRSTGQPDGTLSAMRRTPGKFVVNAAFTIHEGGSEVETLTDEQGRVSITQKAVYRYWVQSPRRHMIGGCGVVLSVGARQDTPEHDKMEIHIAGGWHLPNGTAEVAYGGLIGEGPQDEVEHALINFCRTRVGMKERAGQIMVTHDGRPASEETAKDVWERLPEWLDSAGFAPCEDLIWPGVLQILE
jgi:hypothetical protein